MHRWRTTLRQIPLLLLIIFAAAFTFNELNPKGIDVKRQYFPPKRMEPAPTPAATPAGGQSPSALQMIGTEGAKVYYEMAKSTGNDIVFVDARNEEMYDQGHIPGALLIDYYNLNDYVDIALNFIEPGKQVIVYCVGGDCEDSYYVAEALRDYGCRNLMIYEGGFNAWRDAGLPVETVSFREIFGNGE